MSLLLRPTVADDYQLLRAFLSRAFSLPTDSTLLSQAVLHWKYWQPRIDSPSPRSWILEKNGAIVAHAGIWPSVLSWRGRIYRGGNLIDWARLPSEPGSASVLRLQLMERMEYVISIGALAVTQRRLERSSYRHVANMWSARYPCEELLPQFRRSWRSVRGVLRTVRDQALRIRDYQKPDPSWAWSDDRSSSVLLTSEDDQTPTFVYGVESLEYLSRCPTAALSIYQLSATGMPAGTAVLAQGGSTTVIADLRRYAGPSADLYVVAKSIASQRLGCRVVVARTSVEEDLASLRRAGFDRFTSQRIFAWDQSGEIPWERVRFQFFENDSIVFLNEDG